MAGFPVFVVNLDRDTDRLAGFVAAMASTSGFELRRIHAVYGPDLPKVAATELSQSKEWAVSHIGSIGCWLSHIKGWEAIASETRTCLMTEDDTSPSGLDRLHDLVVPEDADIVFVNDRTSPQDADSTAVLAYSPIAETLRKLERTRTGPGTDGYLLTPNGARKLLAQVSIDLFFGIIDWRLLRYSVQLALLSGDLTGSHVARTLLMDVHRRRPPGIGVLNAYFLNHPVIVVNRRVVSTTDRANEAGEEPSRRHWTAVG